MLANSRAKCNGDTDGLVKVMSCKKTDRLLGVYMVGAVSSAGPNPPCGAVQTAAGAAAGAGHREPRPESAAAIDKVPV